MNEKFYTFFKKLPSNSSVFYIDITFQFGRAQQLHVTSGDCIGPSPNNRKIEITKCCYKCG